MGLQWLSILSPVARNLCENQKIPGSYPIVDKLFNESPFLFPELHPDEHTEDLSLLAYEQLIKLEISHHSQQHILD